MASGSQKEIKPDVRRQRLRPTLAVHPVDDHGPPGAPVAGGRRRTCPRVSSFKLLGPPKCGLLVVFRVPGFLWEIWTTQEMLMEPHDMNPFHKLL